MVPQASKDDLHIEKIHILLQNYYCYLVVIKNYSKNTVKLYYNTSSSFLYFLKINDFYHIYQVEKNIFHKYIIHIRSESQISNQTTNMIISSLNNFTRFLCRNYNFCELRKLKHLKFLSKKPNIIDQEDMIFLLLKQKNPRYDKLATWVSYRNYAICILLYSTGMRISEAMSILLADIDGQWIRVENTKNRKTRVVPINIHVLLSINDYREICPYPICSVLWFSNSGKKLGAKAASIAIKHMFGYTAHYFRHAFATHLILNNCDVRIVQEFLGHSSIATTSIYTHIKPKHLKITVEKCHPLNQS